MATLTATPGTNGQKHEYSDSGVGVETANDLGGKAWSVSNLSGGTVSDTGTFTSTTTINAQFATKPATGNLMVIVITLQSNVRITEPAGWSQIVDAGSTSRAICVFAKRQDGTINAATNIASTTGSNVTGNWTAIDFAGPVDADSATGASGTVEHFTSTSATADTQTPSARTGATFPMLRLSVISFSSDRSAISVSGGDGLGSGSIIGSSARHAIAWDKEDAAATTYQTSQTPSDTSWSWTTGGTGSDVIVEIPGIGVVYTQVDGALPFAGSLGLPVGVGQTGLLFDTSAIGTDTISSAKFEIKAHSNNLTSTKKIELIKARLANGSSVTFSSSKWAEVYDSQTTLQSTSPVNYTTILGSMTGANFTANTTASSAAFNNLNGSSGLNSDTNLIAHINKTGITSVRLIAEENRTTFTGGSTDRVTFHGNGAVGTTDDPTLTVVYAPPATNANATVAAATSTANTAPISAKPTAGVGTATGTGRTAAITGQPTATVATITTDGQTATAAVSPTATVGTVTGSSYDPAVSTSGSGVTATAGAAATTSASYDGTATIGATAGLSATTSAGQNAAGQNAPTGIVAAGTATGQTAASALTSTASAAAGTAAGQTATSDHTSAATVAAGTAAGQTAASDHTSTATVATGSATAASVANQAAVTALAGTVTGNGYDPAVSAGSGTVTATAQTAITAGAGYDPQPSLSTQAASSSATVAGFTITGLLAAGPNTATIVVDSYQPSTVAATVANLAAVTVTAPSPSGAIGTAASTAAVNTAGFTTTQQVQVAAQTAAGTVAAFAGTVFVGQADPHPTFLILDYATGGSLDVDTFAVSDHSTVAQSDLSTYAACDGTDRTVLE